jgi:hypothetical protein
MQPKHTIQRKVMVEEADKARVHGPRAERPDLPCGAVVLAGIPGSGRRVLGREVATRRGLPFLTYGEWTAAGRPEAVVAADERDVAAAGGPAALHRLGRVFYLVAAPQFIFERLLREDPGADPAALRRAVSERFFAAEPVFMQALHFLLPGERPLEEMAADVLERLCL